eukprot:NODE_2214_length_1261_cov_31.109736_g2015_i0.p1 GENE.NODE_2214_length_1261_cov_31.109736_g2015_i0~~NODE_2214_length_1261_cov_31.109736_g2015_i0.p1  ORF type:complete len:295 (+),score=23.09 NODE_2214_length_1261_cov_31.109736_g2015_i0:108-992(+)
MITMRVAALMYSSRRPSCALRSGGLWRTPRLIAFLVPSTEYPTFLVRRLRHGYSRPLLNGLQPALCFVIPTPLSVMFVSLRFDRGRQMVYMAVPRLASTIPFIRLDPAQLISLNVRVEQAVSIQGATRHGTPVAPADMQPIDLVVAGCVGVSLDGSRIGKGGGFSDLEKAILNAAGVLRPTTVACSTIHDLQLLPAGSIPTVDHDFSIQLVATPTIVQRTVPSVQHRPLQTTLQWEELTEEKIRSIPLLHALSTNHHHAGGRSETRVPAVGCDGEGKQFTAPPRRRRRNKRIQD